MRTILKNQFVQRENEVYNTARLTEKPDLRRIMEFYKFVGNNFKTQNNPTKGKYTSLYH
jgi:hypothetical protein